MGQDKAHLDLNGQSLADRVFDNLSRQCSDILISGTQDYGLGVQTIADRPDAPKGPVGGLYSIWQALKDADLDGFITVPIDGPNLPKNFCALMVGQGSAVSATSGGLHPTFAYWSLADLSAVFKTLDFERSQSLKSMARLCRAREVNWPDASAVYNINTPEDLAAWKISHTREQ